jgi:hypothetical protein
VHSRATIDQTYRMPLNEEEAVAVILEALPEFRPTHDEHISDFDELLPHLLMSDLARFTVAADRSGDLTLVDRALAVVEQIYVNGDDRVENVVAVSFVEHLRAENEPGEREVLARFPAALAEELHRQRQAIDNRGRSRAANYGRWLAIGTTTTVGLAIILAAGLVLFILLFELLVPRFD